MASRPAQASATVPHALAKCRSIFPLRLRRAAIRSMPRSSTDGRSLDWPRGASGRGARRTQRLRPAALGDLRGRCRRRARSWAAGEASRGGGRAATTARRGAVRLWAPGPTLPRPARRWIGPARAGVGRGKAGGTMRDRQGPPRLRSAPVLATIAAARRASSRHLATGAPSLGVAVRADGACRDVDRPESARWTRDERGGDRRYKAGDTR